MREADGRSTSVATGSRLRTGLPRPPRVPAVLAALVAVVLALLVLSRAGAGTAQTEMAWMLK